MVLGAGVAGICVSMIIGVGIYESVLPRNLYRVTFLSMCFALVIAYLIAHSAKLNPGNDLEVAMTVAFITPFPFGILFGVVLSKLKAHDSRY